ncbi:helix-turn-helix domain-containing protein [Lentzea cavernae]|uniref:Transcriptional regulator n=1 Tax=Lentzea cavernae TaxID=2020703 RepID=A0ABQ3MF81_9PSEU|nr:helix-turn-helix domain-containing protein [Lentzea cavernae]GHH43384.1 transcriptional regulator [Lentzea cavernae]
MPWWQLNADTLARSRFVVSPLAEVIASLKTLHRGTGAHAVDRRWADQHLPAFHARLESDPITALVLHTALRPYWNAEFLTPTPTGAGETTFDEEVARVRTTPPSDVRAHLAEQLDEPLPRALARDDLAERTADLLAWVWSTCVRPTWPRRRRIIEADVVARTTRLTQGGWAAALEGMRPGMRWLGDSRLRVHTRDYPPMDLAGAHLMFVPVTPRQSWVSWDAPHRYAVTYACSGVDGAGSPPAGALSRLLGSGRAEVLVLLDSPKSTTQLVALTGMALGSVGRHLKVLLDSGLVERRRAGKSVLYYRAHAGTVLIRAQRG